MRRELEESPQHESFFIDYITELNTLNTPLKTAVFAAENSPCIIFSMDGEGKCTYLNKRWYEYTGSNQGCLSWQDYLRNWEAFMGVASLEENGYFSVNVEIKDAKGNYRSFTATGQKVPGGRGISGAFLEAEKENFETKIHPYYKTFAEAMPDMAFIANSSGDIIYYNQRWYEFLAGMKNTEGWGWKERAIHHPDDIQRTILRWNHSLKTGAPYEIEYRLRRYDGKYIWHLGRALPVKDETGKVNLWLGTNTDIHRQKLAEVEKDELNTALRLKNRSLQQVNELHRDLLHLIPHDLRNPLSSILLSLELIKGEEDATMRSKHLNRIGEMVKKQVDIMDGLNAMVEIESLRDLKVEEIDLEILFQELINHFTSGIDSTNAVVETELFKATKFYYVKTILWSILANLFSNALKYRCPQRKLKLKLSAEQNAEFVIISLEDNGLGMDLEKSENPFDPFTRLTTKAEGTGVGLYLVKRLIEKNGGRAEVKSKLGEGTKFTCYLKPYD